MSVHHCPFNGVTGDGRLVQIVPPRQFRVKEISVEERVSCGSVKGPLDLIQAGVTELTGTLIDAPLCNSSPLRHSGVCSHAYPIYHQPKTSLLIRTIQLNVKDDITYYFTIAFNGLCILNCSLRKSLGEWVSGSHEFNELKQRCRFNGMK